MEILVIGFCTFVLFILLTTLGIVLCGCGNVKKKKIVQNPVDIENSSASESPSSYKIDSPSYRSSNEVVLDLHSRKRSSRVKPQPRSADGANVAGLPILPPKSTGGATIAGIPTLPPKGDEVDVPLPPKMAERHGYRRGPRPTKIPQPGHTCPIRPADDDPTVPVEDLADAYKMAALNRQLFSTPPVQPSR